MKTVHFYNPRNEIKRLTDEAAHTAVKSGKAHYVPKGDWKRLVRDVEESGEAA